MVTTHGGVSGTQTGDKEIGAGVNMDLFGEMLEDT